jgi:hypothetical protein
MTTQPELGPAIVKLDDYLAAQAYAGHGLSVVQRRRGRRELVALETS